MKNKKNERKEKFLFTFAKEEKKLSVEFQFGRIDVTMRLKSER